MKIGIHHSKGSFSERWIAYCDANNITYKIVDCYRNDIIQQLSDCDAFMWHFHQNNPLSVLFAKQLLFSIEQSGKKVFPDFNTVWHFNDKVGQKYLLESIVAPLVPTWVFYDKSEALAWAGDTIYPKVFKLRGGAGSQNVRLVKNKRQAFRLIRKAFGRGFSLYNPWSSLKERWRLFRLKKTTFRDVLKGVIRFLIPPPYARAGSNEKGYVFFQKYISGNDHDIRVIVIGNKAFAIKRIVRKNDFRASGSGRIVYDKSHFSDDLIRLSFEIAGKLKSQCIAMDFIYEGQNPLIIEISYGFVPEGYDPCPGYWTEDLVWHEDSFNPYGWMVEDLIKDSVNS